MDNLTHTLFGLTLARTRLGRARGATIALVIASNAPDIDIVTALGGSTNYLAWHRGPTHGPIGVFGLGLVAAGLVWGGSRLLARNPSGHSVNFASLLPPSLAGVVAHILMDLPTSYGTRLLSPFSWRWFAMDLLPIIDIYLLIALAAGLILGHGSTERRRRAAVIVFVLMAANYGVRAAAHQRALAVAARVFGPALPPPCQPQQVFHALVDWWPRDATAAATAGNCLLETAAIPTFTSPLVWRVIARLPDAYEVYDIDLRGRHGPGVRTTNEWAPLAVDAARTATAQVLFGFSRFPAAQMLADTGNRTVVQFSDMRFATDANLQTRLRRSALFTVTVTFGPDRQVLGERLGQ